VLACSKNIGAKIKKTSNLEKKVANTGTHRETKGQSYYMSLTPIKDCVKYKINCVAIVKYCKSFTEIQEAKEIVLFLVEVWLLKYLKLY